MTLLGQGIQFYDCGNVTPYSAQWNFNIHTGDSGGPTPSEPRRTFNGCRTGGIHQIDFTLTKNTRWLEKFNVQFRVEVFNVSKQPAFCAAEREFRQPQFGVVNAPGNLPRIVQFGLKLIRE